ncbi:hypothetical protein PIB30_078419 [Stylosanthes scabra]|uniref:Uncharacterized protein n=1 Tax=Stylosanthes scabra TaxID=79078 RepID=A0ABU6ZPI4_9FABA|nr:hypothetical protein [Stylosanthes scabra]
MRRRMLARKIPRKRSLLHFPCLWTSMLTEDCLRYTEGLRRRPELSPLRNRQVSVSDSPRSQLIDGLPVITLRVMISWEFGNRCCRAPSTVSKIGMLQFGIRAVCPCKAWGWTDYATLHTLCYVPVCVDGKLQMPGRRRGNRRVVLASPTSNGGQPDLVNVYANIAAAIRELAAAIRESNAAKDRERHRNGNDDGNGDDSTIGNSDGLHEASFISVFGNN